MSATLLGVEEALAIIAAEIVPLPSEPVALGAARGRILAEPVTATLDLPPFTNSAMDGFALRAVDTPGTLRIIGESAAGRPYPHAVTPGTAVAISTGAVLPAGADTIAIIEHVSVAGDSLSVPGELEPATHIRAAGSDIRRGETVLARGARVGSAQIGAAAAAGVSTLVCARRPTVAVIPTGSELTAPGQELAAGAIYDSNGPMLRSLLEGAGSPPSMIAPPADDADSIRHALAQGLAHDVLITTGGVSVGPHDLVREVASELGVGELFWGIKMRPGKPLSFGVHGRTLVFGIPGNPVSALVCFEMFVRPALDALQGASEPGPPFQTRLLAAPVQPNSERDEMVRVRLDAAGQLIPLRGQMSHQLAVSAQADGLARVPAGRSELPAGSSLAYLPLRG